MILIKEVSSREDMANAWRIRESVLEAEQGFAHDVNIDGLVGHAKACDNS